MMPSTEGPMSVCRVGVNDPDAVIGTATSAFATFVVETAIASTTAAFALAASASLAGPPQPASADANTAEATKERARNDLIFA